MDQILNSCFIDGGKSTYTLAYHQTNSNKKYVSILQVVHDTAGNEESRHTIKLAEELLDTFLNNLKSIKEKTAPEILKIKRLGFEDEKEIISRYLKGANFRDLVLQFDCDKSQIIDILRKNDIEIIENQMRPPQTPYKGRFKKK